MLKKDVKFWGFKDGEEVEKSATIRLHFTPKSLKLYEERTGGRKLFSDMKEITKPLAKIKDGADESDMIELAFDDRIFAFLEYAIPALYLKVDGDKGVQNAFTFEEAQESAWLEELFNLESLMDIVTEITKGQSKSIGKPEKKTMK